jgi:hypothetical protein
MVLSPSQLAAGYAFDGQSLSGAPFAGYPGQFPLQGVLVPQFVLDPETQAQTAFLQATTACLIPKLSNYVGRNVTQFPQLSQCAPLITRAAELYGQRDFGRALAQVYQVYRLVALLRGQQPSLPDPSI